MASTLLPSAYTSSTVLALSKRAWKLGIALSKLEQDANIVDPTVKALTDEVKALAVECDLVYAELDEVADKHELAPPSLERALEGLCRCLELQVDNVSRALQELEMFVETLREEDSRLIGHAQREWRFDGRKNQIASIRTKVCRQTDNLGTTLLLVNTTFSHLISTRFDQTFISVLDKLRNAIGKLKTSVDSDPHSQSSHTEAALLQCACELVERGSLMYKASVVAEDIPRSQGGPRESVCVADWVGALNLLRHDEQAERHEAITELPYDSDDDLETDFSKSALESGISAFDARKWIEADSLLQEALRVLQQLTRRQRAFCDIFSLHYRLAVCAYYTQGLAGAEEALVSFLQQHANSDETRALQYDSMHLLSQLYVRTEQIDRARWECEKTLQGRRKLLGKQSEASLESMALMAHIYVLMNNRVRSKSCLGLIPEERRTSIIRHLEVSLGRPLGHLDFSSLLAQSTTGEPVAAVTDIQNRVVGSRLGPPRPPPSHPLPPVGTQSLTVASNASNGSPSLSHGRVTSNRANIDIYPPVGIPSHSLSREDADGQEWRIMDNQKQKSDVPADTASLAAASITPSDAEGPETRIASRKEILEKIGCHPRDNIEEAVCIGDSQALTNLLAKRKDFWKSKLRKRVRPERLTALHFASLFGEVDMARRLLASGFGINDVPYGYTTTLSPLKMAIGARQVDMVEFLIANGAKPSDQDTWSTLAGQLLSRSWMMKTVSEPEREFVPNRIIAIMGILLNRRWDINAPCDANGSTVLHQAVSFWTGSYIWDLNLRITVTSFLCEKGADPLLGNEDGKTPYDLALASGHQDLLTVLDLNLKKKGLYTGQTEPVELPGSPQNMVHGGWGDAWSMRRGV